MSGLQTKGKFQPLGDDKFDLGSLCHNNHDHEGTGKSLRYRKVGTTGNCVECSRGLQRVKALDKKAAIPAIPEGLKVCSRCQEPKPIVVFRKNKATKDGLSCYCKSCSKDIQSNYYRKQNTEQRTLKAKASREKRWVQILLNSSRSSAKTRGLEHRLTSEDITNLWESQGGVCYWLNINMDMFDARNPAKPSLDRLDNTKGYINGNVVLACQFANMGRGATTVEVFEKFIQKLRN